MHTSTLQSQLNNAYTFQNFVEGDCNRAARQAGLRAANEPGTTAFNPLVIAGNVGWGKTHLAEAIGNETKRLHPGKNVLYVSTEKFIQQFKEYSANNMQNDFISFYQLIDTLIVDDIQFLTKYPDTHDAFFAIFNHLHQSQKQIVLTCDTAPAELKGLHERLLSRFRSGLSIQIQAPNRHTREAILRQKLKEMNFSLAEDNIKLIAKEEYATVRDMEGVLKKILFEGIVSDGEVNSDTTRLVLKEAKKPVAKTATMSAIHTIVCNHFGLSTAEILTKTRKRKILVPRQIAMYFSGKYTHESSDAIGEFFGKFDRATASHACGAIQQIIDNDGEYKKDILEINQIIECLPRD